MDNKHTRVSTEFLIHFFDILCDVQCYFSKAMVSCWEKTHDVWDDSAHGELFAALQVPRFIKVHDMQLQGFIVVFANPMLLVIIV